jgi:hypothetical protein
MPDPTVEAGAAVPLPPASVDFNALNDALAAGQDPGKARNDAIVSETLALSADEAQARAAESVAEAPSLAGMVKPDLLDVGDREFVHFARDREGNVIPFADASNARMVEAIEAKRAGAPILPETAPADDA